MTQFIFELDMPPNSLILPAPAGVDRDIPVEREPGVISYMKESELARRVGCHEDENEMVAWVEYSLGDRIVHRSARVHLKKAVAGEALAAAIG